MKDENTFKDTKIGRADIRVTQLVQELNVAKWIQIVDCEDYTKASGLISITVQFDGQPPLPLVENHAKQSVPMINEVDRLAQLRHYIVGKHKISKFFANKMFKLEDFEIVLICDDSGSMSSKVFDPTDRFAPPKTRWDELKQTVSVVTEIAGLMDESGIDIYFLNRPPIFGIKSTEQIGEAFSDPPVVILLFAMPLPVYLRIRVIYYIHRRS